MLTDDFFLGTKLHHKKIIKLLAPLDQYLGIEQISFVTVDKDGKGFSITSNCKMVEDNIERQGYKYATFFVHPNNMHSGFALDNACQDLMYRNNLYVFVTKFDWHNSFIYAEKDSNGGYYALDLATNKNNFMIFSNLINKSRIIKQLIKDLNSKIMSTFNKDIQEHKVDLAKLMGSLFYTNKGRVFNEQLEIEQKNKIKLLKKFGIFNNYSDSEISTKIQLSKEEVDFIKIYYKTKNLRKIAKNLNITRNKASCFIENIQNKLDCNNNNELFEKAEILESLGYFYL